MSDHTKDPKPLLPKGKHVEKSNVWGDTAKQRFFKQHGDLDVKHLPQSDAHAIKEFDDPTAVAPISPEETKAAEESLAKKIEELKAKNQNPVPKKSSTDGNFYDEWID